MELVIESKFRIFITTSEVFLKHFRTFRSFNQVTISATIHRREKLKSTNVLDSKFHPVIDFADRYLPTRNFQSQYKYKKYKKLLTIGNFKHWILYWINGFHVRRKKEYDETRQRKRNIVRKNKKNNKKRRVFRWKQGIEKYSRARRNISLICSNHENGIGFFSRGEVAVSYRSENLPPPFDLRRFMENSSPLFRPVSVNNPPMMYLSANFRWKFHRNFYPISSKRPYLPLSPPPLSLRIHLCTRIPIRCSFDVIDHLFAAG